MRLNGYFRAGPLEAAYITAVVSLPELQLRQRLDLLVDTEATKTTILDRDAQSIGISYSKLARSKLPLLGLGGSVETYFAKDAELYFRTERGTEHKEPLQELLIVKHTVRDENIMRIPSVLGRDTEQVPINL
ncbi:MAG: hypothetical protein ACRECH_12350 [Nitrososphaerales archaeon]